MKVYSEQLLIEYHVDFDTENISFLKMAAMLDAAGVENNLFFLRLDNKKLKGIDPFDPKLSDGMRAQVFKECVNNRWYFYREVFRITEAGSSSESGGGSYFKLNRGNLAYLWAMELNISTYLIMPRQTGKTWAAVADCVWVHQFKQGSSILHFNKNQKDANDNLRRMQEAIRMLPLYLQHSAYDNLDASEKRRVKNNEKNMRNTIGASVEAMASAGNESKADALARGRTASKIWWDEIAFIFFNKAIYTASTPAYEKAREIAEKNNIPYAISVTTTPGDLATPHGEFAYKMMESAIRFEENMYDLKRKKLFDIIKNTPDKTSFLFMQFNHLQLGETDDWYAERYKNLNNPIQARREYLLEWMNSNGNSPFDPDDLELIGDMTKAKEGAYTKYKINKYYELIVYSEYHGKKPVLIGVDVSTGRGRDYTAITVVNPENLLPIAFLKSNMMAANILKKVLVTLISKRYPHSILTIENNSIGTPLIDELRDTPIARCLYKEKRKKEVDTGGTNSFTKKQKRDSVVYGHNLNTVSRAQMMEMLENIVHNSHSHMAFPELYEEIRFMELKNGRIDHCNASHDDITMSYLGALWVIKYGKGLTGKGIYYNIRDNTDEFDDDFDPDFSTSYRVANKAVFRQITTEEEASSELVDRMTRNHSVLTSASWAERERAEYNRELDRNEGIEMEDDIESAISSIPDSTQRLLLRNLHTMLSMDTDEDSVLEDLIRPEPVQGGYDPYDPYGVNAYMASRQGSLHDAYKW